MESIFLYLAEFKSYGEGLELLNSVDPKKVTLAECFPSESGSLVFFTSAQSLPEFSQHFVGEVDTALLQILLGKTNQASEKMLFILESQSATTLLKAVQKGRSFGANLIEIRFARSRQNHIAVLATNESLSEQIGLSGIQIRKIVAGPIVKNLFS